MRCGAAGFLARLAASLALPVLAGNAGAGEPDAAAPAATPPPAAPASAERTDGEATVRARVEPALATVGDEIEWRVEVEAPAGEAVAEPALAAGPGEVDVRTAFALEREDERAGRTVRTFRAVVAPFATGPVAMPEARVEIRGPGGMRAVEVPRTSVAVRSVLPPGPSPALKGAKGVLRLRGFDWRWLVAAAALVLVALALWYRRLRRPVVLAAAPRPPEVPFDEQALRDLRALAEGPLLREGKHLAFHVRLSEIVRAYLGSRYGFDALEMTSDELHRALRERRADPAARELVRAIAEVSDFVKFARHIPAPGESERALSDAFRLVDTTRPRETPVLKTATAEAPA